MPDRDHHKTPLPAVMDVGTFFERFGDDESCLEHLRVVRWGEKLERFECPAYRRVAKAGYQHEAVPTGGGREAVQKFPWLHTFISNAKRMILGTYHSVSPAHLADYLAEFDYRVNRRWMEARLFDRLIHAAMATKALTYNELVAGAT